MTHKKNDLLPEAVHNWTTQVHISLTKTKLLQIWLKHPDNAIGNQFASACMHLNLTEI